MDRVSVEEIRFDGRGLVPAVIQEANSGRVLMVAYMNAESLQKTLETGQTWFYSRSRQELWHKGETSGHFQKVVSAAVDCDADTLLFQVEQTGAACHTDSKSCFFRGLDTIENCVTGSLAVLADLGERIREKRLHPTEKSYTAYLLNAGMDKICKKIGEEAAEGIIAAKNVNGCTAAENLPEMRAETAKESADILYHLSVLWEAAGITVNDVMTVLEERSRTQGNKKTAGHGDRTF